jgi:hypothetical protein
MTGLAAALATSEILDEITAARSCGSYDSI